MKLQDSTRDFLLTLLVVGTIVLAAHAAGIVLCPLRRFFGIPCPGCGSTRALILLLRGNVADAVAMNPMAVALVILVPIWWLGFRNRKWSFGIRCFLLILSIVVVTLNWVYVWMNFSG